MNNQNVEPATSKSDIVLVTLAVLCAVAGVIAFSLLTSQPLAVRLGALFGGLLPASCSLGPAPPASAF